MAETFRESVKDALETVGDKARAATNRAADKVEPLHNGIKDMAHAVADTAVHVKDQMVDAAASGCEATQKSLESLAKDVGDIVRKHPVAALAVGLGIGMLLGRATSRA